MLYQTSFLLSQAWWVWAWFLNLPFWANLLFLYGLSQFDTITFVFLVTLVTLYLCVLFAQRLDTECSVFSPPPRARLSQGPTHLAWALFVWSDLKGWVCGCSLQHTTNTTTPLPVGMTSLYLANIQGRKLRFCLTQANLNFDILFSVFIWQVRFLHPSCRNASTSTRRDGDWLEN